MTRILILGKGTIGTFLGMALQPPYLIVKHLIRSNSPSYLPVSCHFRDLRKSKRIKKGTTYHYETISHKEEIAEYDYVLLPLGYYHWEKAIEEIKPYLVKNQVLVMMGNIWDQFDWFDQQIPIPYIFAFPNFGGSKQGDKLKGWLTPNLTTGVSNPSFHSALYRFNEILMDNGFLPKIEKNIKGWHMTHFAWIAGMMTEGSKQGSFVKIARNWNSLRRIYELSRECMSVVQSQGVNPNLFREGKKVAHPLWWNTLGTFLMLLLPKIAKDIDASRKLGDWESYGLAILETAKANKVSLQLLPKYESILTRS